jgi:hypothetical protein
MVGAGLLQKLHCSFAIAKYPFLFHDWLTSTLYIFLAAFGENLSAAIRISREGVEKPIPLKSLTLQFPLCPKAAQKMYTVGLTM